MRLPRQILCLQSKFPPVNQILVAEMGVELVTLLRRLFRLRRPLMAAALLQNARPPRTRDPLQVAPDQASL